MKIFLDDVRETPEGYESFNPRPREGATSMREACFANF